MGQRDFTPAQVREAVQALCKSVGSEATCYCGVAMPSRWSGKREGEVYAHFYAHDISRGMTFAVEATTWRELVATLNAKWAEYSDDHAKRMVRDMALEIIRITADHGECTDAALRASKFSDADVRLYGERACQDATEIAGLGPFTITRLGGCNGAPIEEAA